KLTAHCQLKHRHQRTGQNFSSDPGKSGSAGVPPAVFGVPPKTVPRIRRAPFDLIVLRLGPVGGTPTGATGTVALPVSSDSLQPGMGLDSVRMADSSSITARMALRIQILPARWLTAGCLCHPQYSLRFRWNLSRSRRVILVFDPAPVRS